MQQARILLPPFERRRGCYSAADAIIHREIKGVVEIIIAERGPNTREAGQTMIAIGGMVDPLDESVAAAALREVEEELPGLKVILEEPPILSRPYKVKHAWDPAARRAVSLGKVVDCPPAISHIYFAKWISGETHGSKEALNPRWVELHELLNTFFIYAFDQALLLEHLAKRFGL
ncbi:MAG: NUDIX hydrolase [Patescibacteria group bacterium]|nr:NUDIX hydrolase [bacterium]MDZ4221847.1 NUDIX hydrolase [Patescibacteria group bacterium]